MGSDKSAWLALTLAFMSFALNSVLERDKQQREARIERVGDQLSKLYGPLLASLSASQSAYQAMLAHVSPDGTREGLQAALKNTEHPEHARVSQHYKHWLAHVFQPLNEGASEVVTKHFHLLDVDRSGGGASTVPVKLLLELVAHTSHQRVMLASSEGEPSRPVAASSEELQTLDASRDGMQSSNESALLELPGRYGGVSFPDELVDYVESEFVRLKRVQAKLLRIPMRRGVSAKANSAALEPRSRL